MKTHYGFMENFGDYESPLWGCEETVCGCTGEVPCENATDDWDEVTCKKCLRLRGAVERGVEANEKALVDQMGDMADFFSEVIKCECGNEYERGAAKFNEGTSEFFCPACGFVIYEG